MDKPHYAAGRNIAMKVPPHAYDATLRFYRDVIGLKEITRHAPEIGFEFGSMHLWIDRVRGISQAEIWLEVVTDDLQAAARHLDSAKVIRCDEIEPLPKDLQAFWITSPASIVHLVCKDSDSWQ